MKRTLRLFWLALCGLILPFTALGGSAEQFQLTLPTLETAAVIDGELDDSVWQNAATTKLRFETNPGENTLAPVETEAKIFATKTSLFVAFYAFDPDSNETSDRVRANFADRDGVWGDDLVGIKLDTFNDSRLAYQFFINPYGVQMDSIENELTGQESDAWDGIWYSAGKKTAKGYQVEIELPLRMLNFNSQLDRQTWGIELVRFYPRNQQHRLSTHKIDRNNGCQLCQMGIATGLNEAESGSDLQLTPALVFNRSGTRDIDPVGDWNNDDNIEPGLDIRWGITPSTLLNATINPDFSQVEADAGQLDINSTFALFFPEKRAFFLDNKDYFDSQMSLVHTRNIVSPDYGVKLTSKVDQHTFGFMLTNDTQTNFLVPGNLSSDIATLDSTSYNLAGRYRADLSDALSVGTIVTAKTSDDYHNYVASSDIKYQPTEQDTLTAQYAYSDTLYPDTLYRSFCNSEDCEPQINCDLGHCGINERVLRTQIDDKLNDSYYKIKYEHKRRNWYAFGQYESVGDEFRADLGFIDKVDMTKAVIGGGYNWYPNSSLLSYVSLRGDWDNTHNQAGELLERETEAMIEMEGAMQSYTAFGYVQRDRVGPRHNGASLAIDDNTQLFNEQMGWFYSNITPLSALKLELDINYGDAIDFANDRLGTELMLNPGLVWKLTDSLSLDLSHIYRTLDIEDNELFSANLTDIRLNWYMTINQFIRISSIYTNIQRDPSMYLYSTPQAQYAELGNEVLYGYKLNPQSVFYLGYSDGMRRNDEIDSLTRDEQTYFMKVSYAWLL
ncbi:carbohydrate binding family 9 domain-containing protein [Shewanella psychrotolerans]|uniref:carbohydrate binding family 9 domain-containing protein n=1 Tax=Shewanella psychrotolerans TaxID=2864206 RepID=UPI001C660987|nr:carbohydrate binding family 9 domain-containing protein [Shewanella psychrotolerans]QYK02724.1 carbohydrate binding family 9 domain-containing protein [Shewanella psychrotolerans]